MINHAHHVGYETVIVKGSLPAFLDDVVRVGNITPVSDEFICAVIW